MGKQAAAAFSGPEIASRAPRLPGPRGSLLLSAWAGSCWRWGEFPRAELEEPPGHRGTWHGPAGSCHQVAGFAAAGPGPFTSLHSARCPLLSAARPPPSHPSQAGPGQASRQQHVRHRGLSLGCPSAGVHLPTPTAHSAAPACLRSEARPGHFPGHPWHPCSLLRVSCQRCLAVPFTRQCLRLVPRGLSPARAGTVSFATILLSS